LGFVLASLIIPGVRWRPIRGFWMGVASGIALTTVLTGLDYVRRRTILKHYGAQPDYSTRQERVVTVNGRTVARTLAQIETGMAALQWLHPQSLARDADVLRAVTKPSWSSFSETICVSVHDAGPNAVAVRIVSQPRSIGTIVDYGKGIQNVEELTREISGWLR
jgi:hypothetical protein